MAEYIERTKELILAVNAGARAIEQSKRFHGAIYCMDVFSNNPQEIPYVTAANILRGFDEIPAADVAEVVHAKWKPKYNKEDGYWHNVCSACKTESVFEYEYEPDYDEGLDGEWHYIDQMECGIREHLTNYCPNCGADMRGANYE